MIARMKPSGCQVVELYRYEHYVEDKQRIECREAAASVSLSYKMDGEKFPDLVIARKRRNESAPEELAVGFMAIRSSPQGKADAEHPTVLAIRLPTGDLPSNLARNDECLWRLDRPLSPLPWMPLRIDAGIVDELPEFGNYDKFFEAHEFSDNLNLKLTVHVGIPLEQLRNALAVHRKLTQILEGEENVKVIRMSSRDKANLAGMAVVLSALVNHGGGIMTFGVDTSNVISGIEEGRMDELEHVVKTAALAVDPPIPIRFHRLQTPDHRSVLVVEAGRGLPHLCRFQGKYYREENNAIRECDEAACLLLASSGGKRVVPYHFDEDSRGPLLPVSAQVVESSLRTGPGRNVYFFNRNIDLLPRAQAAIANGGGGYVIVGIRSGGAGQAAEIAGLTDAELPVLTSQISALGHDGIPGKELFEVKVGEKKVLVQRIPDKLTDLYRHGNGFPIVDGQTLKDLTLQEAVSLVTERKVSSVSPLFAIPLPMLRKLSLQWVDFPGNDEFNPETRRMEWKNLPMTEEGAERGHFTCVVEITSIP